MPGITKTIKQQLPPGANPTPRKSPIDRFGVQRKSIETTQREIYCQHYQKCLEYTAKLNWEDFHCNNCPHQEVAPKELLPTDNLTKTDQPDEYTIKLKSAWTGEGL